MLPGRGLNPRLFGVERAPWVLAVALLCASLALARLVDFSEERLRVPVDASLTGLLPNSGEALETYAWVREHFAGDDILLVAWFDDELFSADLLSRLKRFTRSVRRIDGVAQVDGLATVADIRSRDGDIHISPLLQRVPRSASALEDLKNRAVHNPLFQGQFVSPDGRGTLLAIQFDPDLASSAVERAVAEIAEASQEAAGDIEQFVSGPIQARLEISRVLFRDIRQALPLAILATVIVAAVALRNLRGVVLPLLSTGLGLGLTLALFVDFGNALNFVTAIMPPVVFVIGFAFAVHVVSEFDHHYRPGRDRKDALRRSLDELFVPLTLTAFTTALGFASLATSPISSIRLFGTFSSLGTLLCWASALTVIPAILCYAPARPSTLSDSGFLARLALPLARFDMRHRRLILIVGALVALAGVASVSQVKVSTDYLQNFSKESPIRANFERIRTAFDGVIPLQILLTAEAEDAFADPLHLNNLRQFESWLEAQPEIGSVTSAVDLISQLHTAFEAGNPDAGALPASKADVDELLFLVGGDEIERFLDPRRQHTLMHVRTSAVSTNELVDLIARINAELAKLPHHVRGEVTGSSALLAQTLDDIVKGQLSSLAGAVLVIYVVLVVLFGSARVGFLALLPNLLPITCFFSILSLGGITLNLATSLVAAVVLGIAVDDTMHFLSRFNAEARRAASENEGIERAMVAVIRPVTFTTAALCLGFMTLTLGELRSQVEFGALAAATLFLAWIIDLVFTPALASRLRFVTLWEVLSVDLGTAPQETIPLFAGLTHRQARIAAILGQIRTYRDGEGIVRLGETGSDIHVVIEGQARAFLDKDGEERLLRHLTRGDLIGEVALFHGLRTANVAADTPVRVLRLDQTALRRIQARYPKIAAQLYRNLGGILAERLADVTGRLS